ncbi:GDYXXLXY domain-containing protein [Parvibaculaceae bacterium PLY_AMNH_Bact1]|nr:GDYXXLXY domain-containing protein [Parvibaculaceae bacterium PLY_AMNH_Bact1]
MSQTRILIGIAIAVLFQSAILGQMVWAQIALLSSPIEVVLKTTPVDPRDIFRGDYVILNYEISAFDGNKVPIADNLESSDDAYVLLSTKGSIAMPLEVLAAAPEDLPEGQAVIRGRVNYVLRDEVTTTGADCDDCTSILIAYPIDSYFVPEGTGTELEQYRDERALGVIVALNEKGDSAIKGLMIEGQKIYDEPLF